MPVQRVDTLWVLGVQHRYGTAVQLSTAEEHVVNWLQDYVAEWRTTS